jgi:hypothetical protein
MEAYIFFGLIVVHVASLIVGMGSVIVIDVFGLLWILKKVPLSLVNTVANITQKLIWTGWGGLVLSGIGLLTIKGFVDNLTMMKLFFVALVGANGIFLHVIKKSFEQIKGDTISDKLKFRITLASTISQVGWWSAIAIGLLHARWNHVINWPPNPTFYMICIAVGITAIALVGELAFKDNASKKN